MFKSLSVLVSATCLVIVAMTARAEMAPLSPKARYDKALANARAHVGAANKSAATAVGGVFAERDIEKRVRQQNHLQCNDTGERVCP